MCAEPTPQPWNHNIHYHDDLLAAMPVPCHRALDVGCGSGRLTGQLAARSQSVVAIDLVDAGFECWKPNVEFVLGDVLTYPFEAESFDYVAAVAVLHHLPLAAGLGRLGSLVRPGETVAVVGLYRSSGLLDYLFATAGLVASRSMRLSRSVEAMTAPVCDPQATLAEIRSAAAALLPGAVVRRKLLFRYVLIWCKPLRYGRSLDLTHRG